MASGVTVDFNANLARFTSSLDKATNDLSKFQSNASRISRQLSGAFAGIGVGISAVGLISFISSSIDALDKLNDLNRVTGVSVENLAGLSLAAQQSGTDLEGVAQSINKLSVNIGKDGEKFAALGITAKDPLEAFKQLADVFVSIKDPQERAAVAAAALGKSWASAAPLLSEGGAKIGEIVEKGTRLSGVTKEAAAQADAFNDRMVELKASSGKAGVAIANELLPAITSMLDKFESGIRHAGNFSTALLALGTINPFKNGQENIRSYTAELEQLQKNRPAGIGNAFGSVVEQEIARTDAAIAKKKIQIAYLKDIAQQEALLLGKGYERYKLPPPPTLPDSKAPSSEALKKFLGDGEKAAKESARNFEDYSAKISAAVSNAIHENDLIKARDLAASIERLDSLYFDAGISAEVYGAALDKIAGANTTAGIEGADQALKSQTENLARLKDEYLDLIDPVEKYRKKLEEIDLLVQTGKFSPDQATEARFKINDKIDELNNFKDAGKDAFKELKDAIEGWGKASADAFVDFALTGKTSFGGLIDSMLKDLARMAAYNAFKPLFNSFSDSIGSGNFLSDLFGGGSSGGGGTFFGVTAPSAKGNVFTSPGLSAYSGQIVNSPTLFPFAAGIGLMGEAGPEAILPLSRGSDGKLGVAGGGTTNNVVVHVSTEGGTSGGDARELGRRIETAVRNVLVTEKRPGGLLA